jgi:hypothetical protein
MASIGHVAVGMAAAKHFTRSEPAERRKLEPARLHRALRLGAYVACVVGSHGLLDAMTDGGKGIALLWPFTTQRFFFAWRPIPVAPIGVGFLSMRGLRVAAVEAVEFSPLFAYALFKGPLKRPLTPPTIRRGPREPPLPPVR